MKCPTACACGAMLLALVGLAPAVSGQLGQPLREQTVMIHAIRRDASQGIGAGVVLCQRDDRVYVLTAHHVLAGKRPGGGTQVLRRPERTEISFFHGSPTSVVEQRGAGEHVFRFDQDPKRDLLLISFPLLARLPWTASLAAPAFGGAGAEEGDEPSVLAIGNSAAETWAEAPGKLLAGGGEHLFHSARIVEGFSGGPLFNEAGALIGINLERVAGPAIGEEGDWYGDALAVEHILPVIDKWVPATCLQSASPLAELAHLTYRSAMRQVSIKNWEKARELMSLALDQQPREGGSMHLQGMRYTTYLPRYHLGLAYYKLDDCGAAIREWELSEIQGVIQHDKRYRKLKRMRQRCYETLRSAGTS